MRQAWSITGPGLRGPGGPPMSGTRSAPRPSEGETACDVGDLQSAATVQPPSGHGAVRRARSPSLPLARRSGAPVRRAASVRFPTATRSGRSADAARRAERAGLLACSQRPSKVSPCVLSVTPRPPRRCVSRRWCVGERAVRRAQPVCHTVADRVARRSRRALAPLAHQVEPRTFNPVGRVRVPHGA